MTFDPADLGPEMAGRAVALNAAPVRDGASHLLCWLQQTLRGRDNPVIDAAILMANRLGLPVLVYHGLREDYPWASDRLHRFILGASRDLERQCQARGLACVQFIDRAGKREKGLVYRLAASAAVVVVDEHATFVGRAQADRFAARADVLTIAVDGTRLVPFRALGDGLHATRSFRAAHSPLRDAWRALRQEQAPDHPPYAGTLPFTPDPLGAMDDHALDALVAVCAVDRSLAPSAEHPATAAEADARIARAATIVAPVYQDRRNNAADDRGATMLSPYLHFGMVSPWAVMDAVEAAGVGRSARYKLYDEMLTWREWCHWRIQARPELDRYDSLPSWARAELDRHRHDPRDPVPHGDVLAGRTGDATWNACQRFWRRTGWLHNNLRMYWAKQILRWAPTPEEAWDWAIGMNDQQSLDGRDPATCISMRWAFGEAKPGWGDPPIFGRVGGRGDGAILKRPGMAEWVARWSMA